MGASWEIPCTNSIFGWLCTDTRLQADTWHATKGRWTNVAIRTVGPILVFMVIKSVEGMNTSSPNQKLGSLTASQEPHILSPRIDWWTAEIQVLLANRSVPSMFGSTPHLEWESWWVHTIYTPFLVPFRTTEITT